MSESSEKHMLRFGCPGCGTRLVVDPSLAGKEGPCPSCGDVIIAPPIAAATSLVAKAGAPVEIKPRGISKSASAVSPAPLPPSSSTATPDRRRKSRKSGVVASVGGSPAAMPSAAKGGAARVNAATGVTQKAAESKDAKTLLLMVLITCVVVCIALGVYYYMTIGE